MVIRFKSILRTVSEKILCVIARNRLYFLSYVDLILFFSYRCLMKPYLLVVLVQNTQSAIPSLWKARKGLWLNWILPVCSAMSLCSISQYSLLEKIFHVFFYFLRQSSSFCYEIPFLLRLISSSEIYFPFLKSAAGATTLEVCVHCRIGASGFVTGKNLLRNFSKARCIQIALFTGSASFHKLVFNFAKCLMCMSFTKYC